MEGSVLVGCPVTEDYEGCMERWLESVEEIGGPTEILLVNTGVDEDFTRVWNGRVEMHHLGLGHEETPFRRIALGVEYLRQEVIARDCDYFLCVEIDMMVPPETFWVMKAVLDGYNFDYAAHTYPTRESLGSMIGFGCTIFRRSFLEQLDFSRCSRFIYPDTWLWQFVVSRNKSFRAVKVHGLLDLDHKSCGVIR